MHRFAHLACVLLLSVVMLGDALSASELPNPALLVLNKGEAQLAIVDPAAMKVVARVPTGVGPHEVATDGKLAFVTNYGDQNPGNTLSVIDLATQMEVRRVDLGVMRRPHGIEVRDGKAYFTAELNKAVARYDPAANKVDWFLGTGQEISHMLVANRDATAIYTSNMLSDTVTAFRSVQGPRGFEAIHIPVGKGPEAIDLSPDGKQLWTAHSRDGGVSIIDTATNEVVHTIPGLTKHSNRLKFTPDGKRVLISDAEGGAVVVLDVATRQVVQRIPLPNVPLGILVVPDGSRAFVATTEDGKINVIDLASLKVVGSLQVGANPDGMAWVGGNQGTATAREGRLSSIVPLPGLDTDIRQFCLGCDLRNKLTEVLLDGSKARQDIVLDLVGAGFLPVIPSPLT